MMKATRMRQIAVGGLGPVRLKLDRCGSVDRGAPAHLLESSRTAGRDPDGIGRKSSAVADPRGRSGRDAPSLQRARAAAVRPRSPWLPPRRALKRTTWAGSMQQARSLFTSGALLKPELSTASSRLPQEAPAHQKL
jgi:hypothetical protein